MLFPVAPWVRGTVLLAGTFVLLGFGCSMLGVDEEGPSDVSPPCENPAPLKEEPDSTAAPGYIVRYDTEGDWTEQAVEDTTARFRTAYGFRLESTYAYTIQGFAATDLSDKALSGIRCEPVVKYVDQNGRLNNVLQ